ncbi:hypothetical protein F7Q99_01370 [Streptomyces kaniharaensis]|uniref:Uncharacterized protein n=1 Tax=Streptomyces kaniharaensis TaxID=212423 RepID=A0A6N7KMW0_9ACTN|nr:hypothetical protein [Streptomyces kaniharaensis]MQS10963.1 hypothetical protein [Streptomyces kaniharaensis]
MSHTVLALGIAALTACGCVWYLPAVADLQAGADRPRSMRTAAAACVLWWAGLAVAGGLLLALPDWQPAAQIALAGLVGGVLLRVRALRYRREEEREACARWAALDAGPVPRSPRGATVALAGWLLVGAAVASLGAASILLSGGGALAPRLVLAAASAAGVALAFLLVGLGNVRRQRR